MINRDPLPLQSMSLWSIIICCGLITAYILLIAVTSIVIGFSNLEQDGFWIPLSAGIIIIFASLYLFAAISRFFIGKLKERDSINL